MKNYFDFQLKGKDLFSLWLIFYLFFIIPYFLVVLKLSSFKGVTDSDKPPIWMILSLFPLILIAFIWTMYFSKMVFEHIRLKDIPVQCNYRLREFLGMICLGLFLTIITLGIYFPWFMRNYARFYFNNASWNGDSFSFRGEGKMLFIILLLSLVIPMLTIALVLKLKYADQLTDPSPSFNVIQQFITQIILVPYMYFVYRWTVDFSFKEYIIRWDTQFLPAAGKILLEIVLTMITFGIYFPMAILRLYKYFSERTKSNVLYNSQLSFGFDLDDWDDFLYLWGQILLIIVTLGIYFPWGFCKVTQRILGKTYLKKINLEIV